MNFNIPLDHVFILHLHSDLFLKPFCKYCNEINIRGEHKGVHTISSADSLQEGKLESYHRIADIRDGRVT